MRSMTVKLSDLLDTLRRFSDRDVQCVFADDASLLVRIEASMEEVREALESAKDDTFARTGVAEL